MWVPRVTVDFETRSACSLKNSGAWRYSRDPTTEVLCLAFRLPYWKPGRVSLWHPAFPQIDLPEEGEWPALTELVEWIQAGGLLEAHNAAFERCIWTNLLTPVHYFPLPRISQWRCSAAKCAAHALPRKLEDAGLALRLREKKD